MTVELETGREVGPYRLLFRLGKGGMGEVWAAVRRGPSGFTKVLALKLIPAPDVDTNTVVMFFDEGRAAAALEHPAIVRTFDLGRDAELAFIAMELVRGPSLNALLQELASTRSAPLSPAIVAYLGERVGSAIDHAYHRARFEGRPLRLVHRDVSPQNILLDASGNVQLSDFGIARTAVQEHRTQADIYRGKPGYMSPEQAMAKPMDDRSDVFALAIVLYECATLRRLFGRKTARESLEALVRNAPLPIPELVPGFPEPLWRVIAKALEKDRDRRPATAGELVESLRAVGRELPGYTTAARDLAHLIEERFREDAFDVDARIVEASAELPETTRADWPSAEPNTSTWPDAPLGPVESSSPPPASLPPASLTPASLAPGSLAHRRPVALGDTTPDVRAFADSLQLNAPSAQLDPPPPRSKKALAAAAIAALLLLLAGLIFAAGYLETPQPLVVTDPHRADDTIPGAAPRARSHAETSNAESSHAGTSNAESSHAGTSSAAAPLEPPRKSVARAPAKRTASNVQTVQNAQAVGSDPPHAPTEAEAWRRLEALEKDDAGAAARLRAKFVEAKASGDAELLERVVREITGTRPGS